jgi:acetate---CoA ligase (ADP-forming)
MNSLNKFFSPQSVAIIGASATKGKVGNDILLNLKNNFNGIIYPINPKDREIEGLKAYESISKTPKVPDLAIIVIPAELVPAVAEECGRRGCRNLVVISAGFKEMGGTGAELEKQLLKLKDKYKLRILGPNCLGYINTHSKINASFAANYPETGNIAFLSQSGALGTAVLDMAEAQQLGLSYFVSLGNKSDISELDLFDYFSEDKKTKVILAYLESITNGAEFMAKAEKISKRKPIIVLKSGKTVEGCRAVSSHTGSLAGAAEIYSAAFKQSGVIEATDVMDFFDLSEGFSYQDLPSGNRVAILTNAGGPGILITDWLPSSGLKLAELSAKTQEKLKAVLPPAASVHNPVDVLGDALADRYAQAFKLIANDKNVDAIIVALTPQKMTQIRKTAELIGQLHKESDKTVVLCFMGEKAIIDNYDVFAANRLPQFNYPMAAVRVLGEMYKYALWQKEPVIKKIKLPAVKKSGIKGDLTEDVCRDLLLKSGFPLHRAELVKDGSAAVVAAKRLGYPLAVKVVSPQVVHKSDVGGVKVGIKDEKELLSVVAEMNTKIVQRVKGAKIKGYLIGEMVSGLQVIVGLKRDPQFGPVVMLGMGGVYTEIFKDVVFKVAPFSLAEAKKMISELKIYPMFTGTRGQKPLDIEALAALLVKFGELALAYPEFAEIDFNPVMVLEKGQGVKIVDVRIMK